MILGILVLAVFWIIFFLGITIKQMIDVVDKELEEGGDRINER